MTDEVKTGFKKSDISIAVAASFDPLSPLLQYQKDWIEDTAIVKIANKSRRTGLTFGEACDNVTDANRSTNATNTYYLGADKEMAKEYIDACAFWAKHFNAVATDVEEGIFEDTDEDGTKRSINTFEIKFPKSGKKIVALSSNPRNLRGRQGNVVIDEAAFHERLDEVLKAALALTMWGGKVRIISTHNGTDNLFNQLIEDARAGKKKYSIHDIPIDKALSHGLYKRICQVSGQQWTQQKQDDWLADAIAYYPTREAANEEMFCIPSKGTGAYLTQAAIVNRQNLTTPILRLEKDAEFNELPVGKRQKEIADWTSKHIQPELMCLDKSRRHFVGEDFARKGDFTVIVVGQEQQNGDIHVVLTIELRNLPYNQQKQILFHVFDHIPRFSGAKMDGTGNGSNIAEDAVDAYGAGLVDSVHLTEAWYKENMPPMKAAIDDGTVELPKDIDHRDDLKALRINSRGVPRLPDQKTDSKSTRHGDFAIGLCMLIAASKMEGGEIDFQSIPEKNGRWEPDIDADNDDYLNHFEETGTY